MKMVKISVIIPIYNVEKYLEECLNSVINQTLKDIEIICINDGSTDHSGKIADEYAKKDKRVKVIHQKNQGVSVARNIGLQIATGEYIGFVDSDDMIDLDFYEKLYNMATQYQADIACAGIIRFGIKENKHIIEYDKIEYAEKHYKKYNIAQINKNINYVWNKIYKRVSLLKTKILFEPNVIYEDIVFSHKVLYYIGSVVSVPHIAYWYRDNENSLVHIQSDKASGDCRKAMDSALKFRQAFVQRISYNELKRYPHTEAFELKIFGIKIIKIRKYGYARVVYLFNLPVLQITNYKKDDKI